MLNKLIASEIGASEATVKDPSRQRDAQDEGWISS
jgi:hypothetical protein